MSHVNIRNVKMRVATNVGRKNKTNLEIHIWTESPVSDHPQVKCYLHDSPQTRLFGSENVPGCLSRSGPNLGKGTETPTPSPPPAHRRCSTYCLFLCSSCFVESSHVDFARHPRRTHRHVHLTSAPVPGNRPCRLPSSLVLPQLLGRRRSEEGDPRCLHPQRRADAHSQGTTSPLAHL